MGGWADKSGNGRHASQATAGRRPLLKAAILGTKNVLRFDGTDDFFTLGDIFDFPGTAPWTTVTVLVPTIDGSFRRVWSKEDGGTEGSRLYTNNGVGLTIDRRSPSGAVSSGIAWVSTTPVVTTQVYSGTQIELFANGTSGGAAPATEAAVNSAAFWTIGSLATGAPSDCYLGDMAEMLVYERALTAQEQSNLETYLMAKYSIS